MSVSASIGSGSGEFADMTEWRRFSRSSGGKFRGCTSGSKCCEFCLALSPLLFEPCSERRELLAGDLDGDLLDLALAGLSDDLVRSRRALETFSVLFFGDDDFEKKVGRTIPHKKLEDG